VEKVVNAVVLSTGDLLDITRRYFIMRSRQVDKIKRRRTQAMLRMMYERGFDPTKGDITIFPMHYTSMFDAHYAFVFMHAAHEVSIMRCPATVASEYAKEEE
jgi:hypothetical protein